MRKKAVLITLWFIFCICHLLPGLSHKLDVNPGKNKTIWFNLMLNGKKTGYFSFHQYSETQENRTFILRKEEMFMKFIRANNVITVYTNNFKRMDGKGRLLHFHYQSQQAGSKQEINGTLDYKNGITRITHNRDGIRKVENLKIPKDSLTECQALAILKNRGWVQGDSIRCAYLMTEKGSYITVNMKLEAVKKELPGSKQKNLFKVVRTIEHIPGIQSVTWVDSNLIPHKGQLIFPHMTYTLEPTSKEDALQVIDETLASLDLARLQLNNFHGLVTGEDRSKIKKVTLLLKLKKGEPFEHDLDGGLQHILDGNLNHGLRLVIDTHIPEELKDIPICSPPEALAPFLRANSYIESDQSKIIVLANRLMVKRSAWETALKIKNWVYANIMMTFDTGFTSALEVLNSGKGDCTEHAVLTAALCRACGIPARVTFGYNLSFRPGENPLYVGHMWNEVFIGDKWLPIDSTAPGTRPDPFRIRFFSSSLENREIMKTTALFTLTQNLDITLLSTTPSIHEGKKKLACPVNLNITSNINDYQTNQENYQKNLIFADI